MTSSDPQTLKPKLDEDILKQNNIYYREKVHVSEALPPWLRPIRNDLLHFRSSLPRSYEKLFEQDKKGFLSPGQDGYQIDAVDWSLSPPDSSEKDTVYAVPRRHEKDEPGEETKAEWEICDSCRESSIKFREEKEPEATWVKLLRDYVFRRFDEVQPKANHHDKIFSQWALHHDLQWNEFPTQGNENQTQNQKIHRRTGPKPDLTFAFPILDAEDAKKYRHNVQVDAFSVQVLSELRDLNGANLRSAPTTSLRRYRRNKKFQDLGAADLTCFPWAIVEVKKYEAGKRRNHEKFCYCQAANASAEALVLREELESKAKDTGHNHVIFSFTFVGPNAKLWVTYRDKEIANLNGASSHPVDNSSQSPGRIVMRCIWASSLELTWGVLYIRMIVQNMRDWVYKGTKYDIARWVMKAHQESQLLRVDDHGTGRRRQTVSCGSITRAPITHPRRPPPRPSPRSAPANLERPRDEIVSPLSSRSRNGSSKDGFIDDSGIDLEDSDNEYIGRVSTTHLQKPKRNPRRLSGPISYREYDHSDSEREGQSDEEEAAFSGCEKPSFDEYHYDCSDGERITMRVPRTGKSIVTDGLRRKDKNESRRKSSKF